MHGLEADYGDRMNFVYLDIDDEANAQFKQALEFRYQPQIFILDANGNILAQFVGYVSAETLKDAILTALGE